MQIFEKRSEAAKEPFLYELSKTQFFPLSIVNIEIFR